MSQEWSFLRIKTGLYRRWRALTNKMFANGRRKGLKETNFTIISNNCWAGSVYRYYGLPYSSPTAGLYFFASDYVKFCGRLRYYTSQPLVFIDSRASRHYDYLKDHGELDVPVARIDDIEVVFLHYATKEEAEEKWVRRCSRINWDRIFLKFSEMNECTQNDLREFDAIPFDNKICFLADPNHEIECGIFCPSFERKPHCLLDDTTHFDQYVDLTEWLNSPSEAYRLG